MKICKKCKGNSMGSRKNYPHGKKSKPITALFCKNCGSLDIEAKLGNRKNKFKKR